MPSRTVSPQQIARAARQAGIPESLFRALVQQESGGRVGARSPMGAIGPSQLMPGTARGLGVDPYDPDENLAGGARYLAEQLRRFKRPDLALSAYNSGPGGSEASGRVEGFPETRSYVRNVLATARGFGAGAAMPTPPSAAPVAAPTEPAAQDGRDTRRQLALSLLRASQSQGEDEAPDYSGFLRLARQARQQQQGQVAPANGPAGPATRPPAVAAGAAPAGADLMRLLISKARAQGLRVSENPLVDEVDPVHVQGSDHYRTYAGSNVGHGLDVSGDQDALAAFMRWAYGLAGKGLKDAFYTPLGYSIDEGRRWDKTIRGHAGHGHLSTF